MAIAYNQQTGEALYSEGSEWKPAKIAMNPKTGERVAFDGKAWQPLQSKPLPGKTEDGLTTGSKFADKTLDVLGGPTYATNEAIYHGKESGDILKQGVKDIPSSFVNREKQDWQGVKQAFEDTGKAEGPVSGMYNAGKTALRAIGMPFEAINVPLENTYGRMAQAGAAHHGTELKPEEAAIVPEMALPGGIGGKAKTIPKAVAADEATAAAAGRIGINANRVKDADQMQDALRTGINQTKGDITTAKGVAPVASDRELAEQVAKGIGDKRDQVKALENVRWEKAKEAGALIPADGVSNIEDLRRMVGQIGKELKGTGGELASDLRSQKLGHDSDILDLRDKIHELEEANVAGEHVSELGKAKMELKAKRLETARQQLDQKLKISDNLEQRIAEADKAEKAADTGSLPTKIETAADLIQLKQHLNDVNPANLSAVELTRLKDSKAAVDAALGELKGAKPNIKLSANSKLRFQDPNKINFGDLLTKANRRTEVNAERYGGDAAKQLGVDKAFIAAEKKTGRPLVGKDATTNAIAGTEGIVDRIQSTAHVDWLKANMRPKAFNQLMANKLAKTLDEVGWDADALRQNREFLNYVVNDGVGMKTKVVQQKLDDLQTILDKAEAAGASGKMLGKAYRGKDPNVTRALNAAKAASATVAAGGHPTTYALAKAAETLGGGGTAEAKRLMQMQKELKLKTPKYIPGEAIGAALGGNSASGFKDQ